MGLDSTPGWEALLDTLGKQDDRMIDAWKDELNNLLIFVRDFLRLAVQGSDFS